MSHIVSRRRAVVLSFAIALASVSALADVSLEVKFEDVAPPHRDRRSSFESQRAF